MQETHPLWVVAAGFILLGVGLFGSYYALPHVVRNMVVEKVVLQEGSEALERFKKTPQPLHYHVYIFHVENPEDVSARAARPILREKGPYVYDMYKERVDLEFHSEDDTVSYLPKSTYFFNERKSGCRSESDKVTVLHAPIVGTALKLQQASSMGLGIFNDAVPLLFEAKNAFLTTSVRELLFGGIFINCSYPEEAFPAGAICQGLRMRGPPTYRRAGTDFYFSMFGHLNSTSHDRVRVRRGLADAGEVGRIVAIGGNATLSTWREGSACNRVNGTDATIFPPFLHATEALPIYSSGSCRSMLLTFLEDVVQDAELQGVPVRRFITDANMLASGKDFAPNRCFCVVPPEPDQLPDDAEEGEGNAAERRRRRRQAAEATEATEATTDDEKELGACLPRGAMDMSKCFGSPVVLTYPHFYLGAEEFLAYPVGLSPDEEKHRTIVDIEPLTGIPMRAKKRVQLNMYLKKMEDFAYLNNVSEGLFPLLWMEEGVTLEGPSLAKVVSAHRGLSVLRAVPWVAVALGGALMLVGGVLVTGLAEAVASALRPSKRKTAVAAARRFGDGSAPYSDAATMASWRRAGHPGGEDATEYVIYRGMYGDGAVGNNKHLLLHQQQQLQHRTGKNF